MLRFAFALFALALPAAAEDWPRTIDGVTLDAPPQRVVSTSPSLTGILLAIDAPLAATASALRSPISDDRGFFLQWADVADARGVAVLYPNLAFDIESVIVAGPDLVIASSVGADSVLPYVPELQAQGVPVLVLDYAATGWEDLARTLGRATGHEADAERVIADFTRHAQDVGATLDRPAGTVSIVSYGLAGTFAVSKPQSAQARVLAEAGFTVAGLPDAMRGAVTRSSDFDFVSHENLPAAIAGDSVFLLAATDADVARFKADPVLANLPAVREGRVWPLGPTSFRVDYYSGLQMIDLLHERFAR